MVEDADPMDNRRAYQTTYVERGQGGRDGCPDSFCCALPSCSRARGVTEGSDASGDQYREISGHPSFSHLLPVPVQPSYGFARAALDGTWLAETAELPEGAVDYIAHSSYDHLGQLTGLSRKLISAGLEVLVQMLMIERVGSVRSGDYRIQDLEPGDRWAKLPGQALLSAGKTNFEPLTRFDLRSKYALAAMKLYCYYASTRDHRSAYSHPSFETSFERTGVAERDIPRANSLL
jgi:hypothetical protein